MKILFINETLSYANATSYAYDLAKALVERGVRVRLCTGGGGQVGRFRELGVEIYPVYRDPLSFRKLLGFLRQFELSIGSLQTW